MFRLSFGCSAKCTQLRERGRVVVVQVCRSPTEAMGWSWSSVAAEGAVAENAVVGVPEKRTVAQN